MTAAQFKERFLSLHARLYDIALKYLGESNEAEDAVQTLYMHLWEKRSQLTTVKDEWAFSKRAMQNLCCDRWRALTRNTSTAIDDEIPDNSGCPYEAADFEEFVSNYIKRLPTVPQRVMKMRMQGATTEEITSATGLSASNVRTTLSRVRQELRKFYK